MPRLTKKMMIRVDPEARQNHYGRVNCGHATPWSPKWERMMRKVEGRWLEVETDHLFSDQFNTEPIPGVSSLGMRIMGRDVVAIINDCRPGVWKCSWCYGYDTVGDGVCDDCERDDHLFLLADPPTPELGETTPPRGTEPEESEASSGTPTVRVENHGTLFLFWGGAALRSWAEEYIGGGGTWTGEALVVEHSYAPGFAEILREYGFIIETLYGDRIINAVEQEA